MSPEPYGICCIGAGGHGRVVAAQWRARMGTEVVFADESLEVGNAVGGVPVRFNRVAQISGFPVIVTIGDNSTRARLQHQAVAADLAVATFVADPANYFGEPSGAGSMILAGVIVNSGARIGRGVIVNSAAIIEHDCVIGDFTHVSPGSCVAGGAVLGDRVWVGAGATILPQIAIAAHTVIGAGSTVIRDILEPGVYAGSPASRIR